MPQRKPGESKDEWMSRCISHVVSNEGKSQDFAIAKCAGMWEEDPLVFSVVLIGQKTVGPGSGWWGPPRGTHGTGLPPVKRVDALPKGMGGINETSIITFADDSKGLYKAPNMKHGSVVGEVVASQFSDSIGWDLVPTTIEYEHNGEVGSLQRFVNGKTALELKHQYPEEEVELDLERMDLMDDIFDNPDRHGGNYMVDSSGDRLRLWAIDNGGMFGTQEGPGSSEYYPNRPGTGRISFAKNNVPARWQAYTELAEWHLSGKSIEFMDKSIMSAEQKAKLKHVLDLHLGEYQGVRGS